MRYIRGFFMSLGNFSVIPCPYRPWDERARGLMLVFLPIVGLLIGFLWYLLSLLMDYGQLPIQLKAALLAVYPFLVTGFMHLDGFMDTTDAILSRRPLVEKQRILKDPHCGAFGVIAVAILLLFQFSAVWAVLEGPWYEAYFRGPDGWYVFLLIPVVSRACSALSLLIWKPLSHSQYANKEVVVDKTKEKRKAGYIAAVAAILVSPGILFGLAAMISGPIQYKSLLVLAVMILIYGLSISHARRELGGVSGDLTGYALTISEAGALMALAVL